MTAFRWMPESSPQGLIVRQVYGYCFDDSGRVLLVEDDGDYNLPGGTPEAGEEARTTLERECLEEAQIVLGADHYLGYQEVTEPGLAPYAQLRYAVRITQFLPRRPDPDNGRTYRRLLSPISAVPSLLDWGVAGVLQAAAAVPAACQLGVDPDITRESAWRD